MIRYIRTTILVRALWEAAQRAFEIWLAGSHPDDHQRYMKMVIDRHQRELSAFEQRNLDLIDEAADLRAQRARTRP